MRAALSRYEDIDRSNQSLLFEDKYFPAYFRLLKWKFLDVCVMSSRNDQDHHLGYFRYFSYLFAPGELEKVVKHLIMDTPPVSENPMMKKLQMTDCNDTDEKIRKQTETYIKMSHAHHYKVQRRRYAQYFLDKVLFNEKGLRIADTIMFAADADLYGTTHWKDLPDNWLTAETFKQKFYNEEEVDEDRFGPQLLDVVANSARGNIILRHLKLNNRCENEHKLLIDVLNSRIYDLKDDSLIDMLSEGPIYEMKTVGGTEQKVQAEQWNVHKTLILFLSLPGFNSNERKEKNEHEEWFYGVMEAMTSDPHNRAALFFLNKNYVEELEEREKERDRIRLSILKGQRTDEEAVGDRIVTEIRPQPADIGYNPEADVTELKLRTYQEELVQTALEGKNCVIVAPTGSGKTEVAIYAAFNHIAERNSRGKAARVVLLVPKIPLVAQQRDRFLKYCNGKYEVNGFHGSEKSDSGEGRRDDVLKSHILVMTAQILINMLQSVRQNERVYVSDFSMMIFDEVHQASGSHPYVEISQIVQEWEYEKPQIIGLTASLNVNVQVQPDEGRMLESIYHMLGLLNTPNLCSITHQASIDELNQHVTKPDDSVEICPPGENGLRDYIERYLVQHHTKLCTELEKLTKTRHSNFPTVIFRKFKKTSPKNYEYYESLLQAVIQELNKLNTEEKIIAQLYTKYLKVYVEARGIVDVMPALVAIKFMEKEISSLDGTHSSDMKTQFGDFMNKAKTLKEISGTIEPTIVKKMKDTLVSQFQSTPDSRVIIFVTQRSTAQRVSEFLNESRIMEEFGARGEELVGYVLGSNKGGVVAQSAQEQKIVLDKFNNGRLKVIVATSVVEEGLDVTACNLIIKYNCSSGSAIQLVQQRGRARAKNSRSVLLAVKNNVSEKESGAMISEKYMQLCVKKIMQNGPKALAAEVEKAKEVIANTRKRELEEKLILKAKHENKSYSISCSNCAKDFCKSIFIKKYFSNYMAFDPNVWHQLIVEPRRKVSKYLNESNQALCTLKCASCKMEVGKAYKYRGVYLPQLAVRAVSFRLDGDSSSITKAKWASVEQDCFYVSDPTQQDYENMLNALSNSEDNMDKKRLLDFDSKQLIRDIERNRVIIQDEKDRKEAVQQENAGQTSANVFDEED